MQKTAAKNTKYWRNKTIFKIGHLAKAIDFAKWSVWVENSNGEKRAKNDSTSTLELFCAKNRWKKHQIFRNETILKIGHLAKAIDFAKWSAWLKNSNGQKRTRNDSTSRLELFCAKNRWKKHQIFEKWDHFKNRPSCKGKGYLADFAKWSVWVKNSNGQKHAKNDSTSTLELFCAKNRCKKKNQILQKWDHFENRPSCKGYRLCKMVSLGQKFKWPKRFQKRFYKQVRVVLCKKPLQKTPNFPEMRPSWKSAILQRHTLCKMVSMGQNFKSPKTCEKRFYKHVRVLLCKKPLEKAPNIREMRPVSKSATLQRL